MPSLVTSKVEDSVLPKIEGINFPKYVEVLTGLNSKVEVLIPSPDSDAVFSQRSLEFEERRVSNRGMNGILAIGTFNQARLIYIYRPSPSNATRPKCQLFDVDSKVIFEMISNA